MKQTFLQSINSILSKLLATIFNVTKSKHQVEFYFCTPVGLVLVLGPIASTKDIKPGKLHLTMSVLEPVPSQAQPPSNLDYRSAPPLPALFITKSSPRPK